MARTGTLAGWTGLQAGRACLQATPAAGAGRRAAHTARTEKIPAARQTIHNTQPDIRHRSRHQTSDNTARTEETRPPRPDDTANSPRRHGQHQRPPNRHNRLTGTTACHRQQPTPSNSITSDTPAIQTHTAKQTSGTPAATPSHPHVGRDAAGPRSNLPATLCCAVWGCIYRDDC